MIFDETTLRKLSAMRLVARGKRTGVMKGDRRSTRRGSGMEFADYRLYTPGDDLRRVDWNVYARLDRPFLKLFEEEEDLAVHLLVDCSGSMDWGEGDAHKLRYAARLAAALGVIALSAGDRLRLHPLGLPGAHPRTAYYSGSKEWRGEASIQILLQSLEDLSPGGETQLSRWLRDYALEAQRPGLAFILSDLLSPEGYLEGLNQLLGSGYEAAVIHLLTPDEIDPILAGELRLIDRETGAGREVSVDGSLRQRYRQHVQGWQEEIRSECARRGVGYYPISTAQPWEDFVLRELRQAGMIR